MALRPTNELIINNMNAGGGIVSSAIWTQQTVRLSFQAVVSSGTINGTFVMQASNQLAVGAPPMQFNPTNWSYVPISWTSTGSISVTASSSALQNTWLIPATEVAYNYVRLQFLDNSSTSANGVVSVRLEAKNL